MSPKKNLVILISGSGSNLQSIIDAIESGQIQAEIKAVISNKANAFGLERAKQHNIPTLCVDHTSFDSREAFDLELANTILAFKPDLVVLAGFMRILTPGFTQQFVGKMLNIHPSLLPKYPGLNTHQRAIEAGDKKAGASIHFVTAELDGGPCVLQASVNISPEDNAESLAKKVLKQEHIIYPKAIQWFTEGRLVLENNIALLDKEAIGLTGRQL